MPRCRVHRFSNRHGAIWKLHGFQVPMQSLHRLLFVKGLLLKGMDRFACDHMGVFIGMVSFNGGCLSMLLVVAVVNFIAVPIPLREYKKCDEQLQGHAGSFARGNTCERLLYSWSTLIIGNIFLSNQRSYVLFRWCACFHLDQQ